MQYCDSLLLGSNYVFWSVYFLSVFFVISATVMWVFDILIVITILISIK
jgi:hypothetical protein